MSDGNNNRVKIGISGWTYPEWRGTFYSPGVKQKDELAFAGKVLNTLEINGTFYSLQRPHTFQKWYDETPPSFVFAVKGPKYITHERRLKEFERPLANFLASGLLLLKEKLGAILWQFPPILPFKPERFEPFFKALPRTFAEACVLAKGHSDWMNERAVTDVKSMTTIRHAIEVRHESFKCDQFVSLARDHGVGIVVGDTAGRWPYIEESTTNFMYARLHGDETVYPKGYTTEGIDQWEHRLRTWAGVNEQVFAFFDNDYKLSAPANAITMLERFGFVGQVPVVEQTKAAAKVARKAKAVAKKKQVKKTGAKKVPAKKNADVA